MPINLSKLDQRLLSAAAHGNLVPFVGSGVSRHATTSDPKAFPTWIGLLTELEQIAESKGYIRPEERTQIQDLVNSGKFLMAAQALRSVLPNDLLDQVLRDRFNPPDALPGALHRAILQLRPALIITTNYDLLLEDAFAQEYRKVPQSLTYKEAPAVQAILQSHRQWVDRPTIFKIHGSALNPAEAILAELDYRNLLYREPGYRMVLSAVFVTKVVLMIGFSFQDPEIRFVLEGLRDSLKYRSSPDYIVLPADANNSVERVRWRQDFGIDTIEYEPSPDHHELVELVEHLVHQVPSDAHC